MAKRTAQSRARAKINKNRQNSTGSRTIQSHNQNASRKSILYANYYDNLSLIATNMYRYTNLPPYVERRILERYLIFDGQCLFFNDNKQYFSFNDVYLTLPFTFDSIDVYGEPSTFHVKGDNGYSNFRTFANAVPIYNNDLKKPYKSWIHDYAFQLAEIHATIETNLKLNKYPVIIRTTKNHEQAFRTMFSDVQENVSYIILDQSVTINDDTIGVIETKVPYLVDKMYQQFTNIWNEAMTFFGVDNFNTFKKERLTSTESEGANGQINMQREIGLITRKEAVEQINDMFNLNIEVEHNYINRLDYNMLPQINVNEVENNEPI